MKAAVQAPPTPPPPSPEEKRRESPVYYPRPRATERCVKPTTSYTTRMAQEHPLYWASTTH